jgi:hypothetical protein
MVSKDVGRMVAGSLPRVLFNLFQFWSLIGTPGLFQLVLHHLLVILGVMILICRVSLAARLVFRKKKLRRETT